MVRKVGARRIADSEIGAEKSRAEFGDKLLRCIRVIAETFAELAIAEAFDPGPTLQLVKLG